MKNNINIAGLERAEILAGLYNEAKPIGVMKQVIKDPITPSALTKSLTENMTIAEAQEVIRKFTDFHVIRIDHLNGRPLKISFDNSDELDPYLYDRYNGDGGAAKVIQDIRNQHEHSDLKVSGANCCPQDFDSVD
jgi:hypothetical protein